nr:uncharacterized protein LOC111420953 isoform X1 [Onthophagus taurus]
MKFSWITTILIFKLYFQGYTDGHARKSKHLTDKEVISNLMLGKGGTTIIETGLSDHLVAKNGVFYTCSSMKILETTVKCKSKFQELTIDDTEKYCFAQRYSTWHNTKSTKYCIGNDGEEAAFGFSKGRKKFLESNEINEEDDETEESVIQCVSSTGTPALFIDHTEYVKMCKIKPDQERLFVFYANTKRNVPQISPASSIRCDGLVCRFRAKLKLDTTIASSFRRNR